MTTTAAAAAAPIAQEFPGETAVVLRLLIKAPTRATGSPPMRRDDRLGCDDADEAVNAAAALAGAFKRMLRTKFPTGGEFK